ncbi:MAG: hypothetical protein RSA55_02655, partial [Clostridia bacterium]
SRAGRRSALSGCVGMRGLCDWLFAWILLVDCERGHACVAVCMVWQCFLVCKWLLAERHLGGHHIWCPYRERGVRDKMQHV